ncbi:vascular endothelial growth factor A-A [Cryptotermes secundus]|uniref:vascular endothelial growth factor A-A n=1 Tax=Cryptotermes secundus TaxID=105785 RepID=UPI000CD7BA98|nr:vascular endothelial growth factor A-A [Cryptotermes secundus]
MWSVKKLAQNHICTTTTYSFISNGNMGFTVIFLLLTCVFAQREHTCENKPDIIHTFEEILTCKDKIFTSNFNKGMMDSTCSQPRDTVVPIISDEPGIQYIPSTVVVKKCAGACLHQLSCIPTEKKMVPFSVRRHREGESITCGTIYVEEHVRCKCNCRVMESHCIPEKQEYDRRACMCRCMNMDEKEECEKSGRLWDQKACKCQCIKEHDDCTTGHYWVPTLCRCMRMMDDDNNID